MRPSKIIVNPGLYNRRVTIQQEQPVTVDAFGSAAPAWGTVVQTWAAILPKTYQATALDGQPIIRRQAHYQIRNIPSTQIKLGMRLVDSTDPNNQQAFAILDIQDILGAQRALTLICQLIIPDLGA